VNHALRLATDASATAAGAMGFVGVVHPRALDLGRRQDIQLEIDAGDRRGLRVGVYLVPVLTWEPPEQQPEWLKFEYVQDPPVAGVQRVLAARRSGRLTVVGTPTAAAPRVDAARIAHRSLRITLDRRRVRVFEDGTPWQESTDLALPFSSAYLYLQVSAPRGDRPAEGFFDDLVVRGPCRPTVNAE
jgi:hypothetical protein